MGNHKPQTPPTASACPLWCCPTQPSPCALDLGVPVGTGTGLGVPLCQSFTLCHGNLSPLCLGQGFIPPGTSREVIPIVPAEGDNGDSGHCSVAMNHPLSRREEPRHDPVLIQRDEQSLSSKPWDPLCREAGSPCSSGHSCKGWDGKKPLPGSAPHARRCQPQLPAHSLAPSLSCHSSSPQSMPRAALPHPGTGLGGIKYLSQPQRAGREGIGFLSSPAHPELLCVCQALGQGHK